MWICSRLREWKILFSFFYNFIFIFIVQQYRFNIPFWMIKITIIGLNWREIPINYFLWIFSLIIAYNRFYFIFLSVTINSNISRERKRKRAKKKMKNKRKLIHVNVITLFHFHSIDWIAKKKKNLSFSFVTLNSTKSIQKKSHIFYQMFFFFLIEFIALRMKIGFGLKNHFVD